MAIELINEERQRQINVEGWTPSHDDDHVFGELVNAAMCYLLPTDLRSNADLTLESAAGVTSMELLELWPWDKKWWKPTPHDRIKELVKAGALIAAEIDRLQRLKTAPPVEGR